MHIKRNSHHDEDGRDDDGLDAAPEHILAEHGERLVYNHIAQQERRLMAIHAEATRKST